MTATKDQRTGETNSFVRADVERILTIGSFHLKLGTVSRRLALIRRARHIKGGKYDKEDLWNSNNDSSWTKNHRYCLLYESLQFGDVAAAFFYQIFEEDANASIPFSRVDTIKALMKESPKLRYIIVKIIEHAANNKKLIVFCEYPITLLLLESVANLLGRLMSLDIHGCEESLY